METYKRTAISEELQEYCIFAKENDIVEVTAWANGEGVDIYVSSVSDEKHIAVTYGEFDLIKKLVKKVKKIW